VSISIVVVHRKPTSPSERVAYHRKDEHVVVFADQSIKPDAIGVSEFSGDHRLLPAAQCCAQ